MSIDIGVIGLGLQIVETALIAGWVHNLPGITLLSTAWIGAFSYVDLVVL